MRRRSTELLRRLQLDIDVTALLPPYEISHGFDNLGDALGVSPQLLERYLSVADTISAIAVEYGCVIKDVAQAVQANVARVTGLMLGTRVAAVNVSVGDVRMPAAPPRPRGGGDQTARA